MLENALSARAAGLNPDNWWPLLTNTFLHGGWLHLILNMWTLWIFGAAMEARFVRLGFAVLYFAGGVVASATHLIANYDSPAPSPPSSPPMPSFIRTNACC